MCTHLDDLLLIVSGLLSKLADYRAPGFESGLMQQGIYVPKGVYLFFPFDVLYIHVPDFQLPSTVMYEETYVTLYGFGFHTSIFLYPVFDWDIIRLSVQGQHL